MPAKLFETEEVRGWIHEPSSPIGDGLALTHGAGSNGDAPLLRAIAEQFSAAGYVVLRYDLPYRWVRPHGPPFPAQAARDREGIRQAAQALGQMARRVFLGGHSYGGRQTTLAAADDSRLAAGLLLLSYPLHPPRKPQQPRTEHFSKLRTPALFVHGSRDPFGTEEEMIAALTLIPARTELMMAAGAPHGLPPAIAPAVFEKWSRFIDGASDAS